MADEVLEKRGPTSKVFDLGSGKFRAEIGNHSHTLKRGVWIPTDTSIVAESGTDSGLQYIAKSRAEFLDYDVKFGKSDPVWMKLKHIPTGNKVTFKPKNNDNKPDRTVVGNKISVSQVWDGIDMEIFVTDNGIKSNYILTSTAGQRVVSFDVTGDVASFRVSPPWYRNALGFFVFPPVSFSGGVLSYDFTQVPVGTVIDPTLTTGASDVTAREMRASGSPWSSVRGATTANDYVNNLSDASLAFVAYDAGTYYCARTFVGFDTSSIGAGATVSAASINWKVTHKGAGSITHCYHSGSNPAVADDFDLVGSTEATERKTVSGLTLSAFNTWSFVDYSGIATTGITKLVTRGATRDFDNVAPTGYDDWCNAYSGAASSGDRPYLTIDYTVSDPSGQPRLARSEHYRRPLFGPKVF